MKKQLTIIAAFLIFIFLLMNTACKPGPCENTVVQEDTLKIPEIYLYPLDCYTPTDTLYFTTETGDTIELKGKGLIQGYITKTIEKDNGCLLNKWIEHREKKGYEFNASGSKPLKIEYYVSNNTNQTYAELLYINSAYDKFESDLVFMIPELAEIEINGKTYKNIFRITNAGAGHTDSYIYYTPTDGIIKIIYSGGKTLSKLVLQ